MSAGDELSGALPAAVLEEAAAWFISLSDGEPSEAQRQRWLAWRAAHPDHERAWQRTEGLAATLAGVDAAGAAALQQVRGRPPARRRLLGGGLTVVVLGGWALSQLPQMAAGERTALNQRRELRLPDGSRLLMNGDTALDLDFDAQRRCVRLHAGELLVETAQDPLGRPFWVETRAGRALALGTRYTVRIVGEASRVGVLAGRVQLLPHGGAKGQVLHPGESASFMAQGLERDSGATYGEEQVAWRQGMLVAQDLRLDAFAAELGRYRPGRLSVDPAVAGLRISGAFPIDDGDRALLALTRTLPVRIVSHTRYWVRIAPR